MGAVAVGALLMAALLVIVAAMVWQEARSRPGSEVVYVIDDAARFVHDRLRPGAAARLGPEDVRRILEWSLFYGQVVVARAGGPAPVVGSGDSLDYVMEQSRAAGSDHDPLDVAEVLAVESEYLMSIGAVGEPAAPAEEERT